MVNMVVSRNALHSDVCGDVLGQFHHWKLLKKKKKLCFAKCTNAAARIVTLYEANHSHHACLIMFGQSPVSLNLRGGMRLQSTNAVMGGMAKKENTLPGMLGRCKVCIYVIERIKTGYPYKLPGICTEMWNLVKNPVDFASCHLMLASLSWYGPSINDWLNAGKTFST